MNSNVMPIKKRGLRTAAEIRKYILDTMLAVGQGEMKARDAAIIIKGGEVVATFMYVEAKMQALAVARGEVPPRFGELLAVPDREDAA